MIIPIPTLPRQLIVRAAIKVKAQLSFALHLPEELQGQYVLDSMQQMLSLFINSIEPDRAVNHFSTKNDPAIEDLLNDARSFTILDSVHIKLSKPKALLKLYLVLNIGR